MTARKMQALHRSGNECPEGEFREGQDWCVLVGQTNPSVIASGVNHGAITRMAHEDVAPGIAHKAVAPVR